MSPAGAPRFLVLAEGRFDTLYAKTATVAIRYVPERVVGVLDSHLVGKSVEEVIGFGGDIPIIASLEAGLALGPDALLIGIAPAGGALPPEWVDLCVRAAEAGLHVWSGMHAALGDEPRIAEAADRSGVELVDLRVPRREFPVATGAARNVDSLVLLTVGSDCAVGKLTTSIELAAALERRGVSASMVPTGQTGILIAGWGVAVDAVKSDFVAGAAEWLVVEAARRGRDGEGASGGSGAPDVLIVEGQGALSHPGYSGVTLGLVHGTMPQGMILCHEPGRRQHLGGGYDWTVIPELATVVRMYEEAAGWLGTSRVLGVALNTSALPEGEGRQTVERAAADTGLPATDPVRFGTDPLIEPILAQLERRL